MLKRAYSPVIESCVREGGGMGGLCGIDGNLW